VAVAATSVRQQDRSRPRWYPGRGSVARRFGAATGRTEECPQRLALVLRCDTVQEDMASRGVNKVILMGNLGKDAETKFTQSGTAVSNFTVATNRRWKDQHTGEWKEETEWHRCVLWRSENRANYLTKGTPVFIEGRLQTRSWEDKDGQKRYVTEVICEDLILLSGGRADVGAAAGGDYAQPVSMPRSAQRPPAPAASAPADELHQDLADDDVPF